MKWILLEERDIEGRKGAILDLCTGHSTPFIGGKDLNFYEKFIFGANVQITYFLKFCLDGV